MGRTTELRREIKRRFFPAMTAKGFSADMRHAPCFVGFRRMTPEAIHVCDIQWDKFGRPRFVINFAKCSPAGVICHGQPVRPEDVTASRRRCGADCHQDVIRPSVAGSGRTGR